MSNPPPLSYTTLQSTERRLVETGRVCLCNYGKNLGKLCVIVNVIDGRRALVDGPSTVNGLKRQVPPEPYPNLAG